MNPKRILSLTAIIIALHIGTLLFGQVVKIMPMGNSITYDDRSGDSRPEGDRISYRFRLYQLLNEAGYSFDFIGSENAGLNYFLDPEYDDNAGFPGIRDDQLAVLINTGYNGAANQNESPGPYLNYYHPDIILLHIGTNGLNESPDDVEDILDNIRRYKSDVVILVARIINRKSGSPLTTTFNNNVEAMVNARGDSRIIMVNMETGAGINYISDMYDDLHPNQTGYDKMAAKWFEVLDNLNEAPVVTTIPNQSVEQGTGFTDITLDNYVSDVEDTDNNIVWTYRQIPGSKLNIYVNSYRVMHVTVNDNNWYGNETIVIKATDSGNGAFPKSDSVEVTFSIFKKNEPPVITSTPLLAVNEDNNYNYTLIATDNDGDALTYTAVENPSWLTFSASTRMLTGKPTNSEVGIHSVKLRVSDGKVAVDQNFEITVLNVNDLPVVSSTPDISAIIGQAYWYELTASDVDAGDILTYSFVTKPQWMSFVGGTEKGILFGTPSETDLGPNAVILKVNDGHVDVILGFTINVTYQTSVIEKASKGQIQIFPNPAKNILNLKMNEACDVKICIHDATGTLKKSLDLYHISNYTIDISELTVGIYIYSASINGQTISGKIVKIR